MTHNFTIVILLTCCCILGCAMTQTENSSPRYQSLLNQYEYDGDLAWVYRLAVVAKAESSHENVIDWLGLLSEQNWRMGVDPVRFDMGFEDDGSFGLVEILTARADMTGRYSERVYQIDDRDLIPESIAYDAQRRVLYVGSLSQNKVVAIRRTQDDGRHELNDIGAGQLGAVYGIKWDKRTNELWVLHNRLVDGGLFGSLSVFDVDGVIIRSFESSVPGVSELNDLCLTKDSVFVTDSRNDSVMQSSRSGNSLQTFVKAGGMPYANGIACNETSATVFVTGATGIHAFDVNDSTITSKVAVPTGYSLGGVDGLYLYKQFLIGIQNALGAAKVVIVKIDEDNLSNSIAFRDVLSPDFRIPTTGFIENQCLYYIGNSSLDAIGPDYKIDASSDPPDQALVLGLPLERFEANCAAL